MLIFNINALACRGEGERDRGSHEKQHNTLSRTNYVHNWENRVKLRNDLNNVKCYPHCNHTFGLRSLSSTNKSRVKTDCMDSVIYHPSCFVLFYLFILLSIQKQVQQRQKNHLNQNMQKEKKSHALACV